MPLFIARSRSSHNLLDSPSFYCHLASFVECFKVTQQIDSLGYELCLVDHLQLPWWTYGMYIYIHDPQNLILGNDYTVCDIMVD